ncbi:MAG: IS1096 element passenger TnpR family protein [Mycobacteriales bacterium]
MCDRAASLPPEDCGGVPGYYELLEALSDPGHEQHAELTEWVGGSFDPELCDIDQTNTGLVQQGR